MLDNPSTPGTLSCFLLIVKQVCTRPDTTKVKCSVSSLTAPTPCAHPAHSLPSFLSQLLFEGQEPSTSTSAAFWGLCPVGQDCLLQGTHSAFEALCGREGNRTPVTTAHCSDAESPGHSGPLRVLSTGPGRTSLTGKPENPQNVESGMSPRF